MSPYEDCADFPGLNGERKRCVLDSDSLPVRANPAVFPGSSVLEESRTNGGRSLPLGVAIAQAQEEAILPGGGERSKHHRTVIILYDLHDLSYDQIARITKTRVGTVKSRLNRARLALKDLLSPHMELLRE